MIAGQIRGYAVADLREEQAGLRVLDPGDRPGGSRAPPTFPPPEHDLPLSYARN